MYNDSAFHAAIDINTRGIFHSKRLRREDFLWSGHLLVLHGLLVTDRRYSAGEFQRNISYGYVSLNNQYDFI